MIPLHICFELSSPEVRPGLGKGCNLASRMPVPEAAVDEDGGTILGQHDIWLTWKTADVDAEPVPKPMEQAANGNLRLGILGAKARHQAALRLGFHARLRHRSCYRFAGRE